MIWSHFVVSALLVYTVGIEGEFHAMVESRLPSSPLCWWPNIKSGTSLQGLFARRRQLLLTEGPHLYYVDPVNRVLKGEIPWSLELRPEAKNFKTFFVHTVPDGL